MPRVWNSFNRCMRGITECMPSIKAMNSTSVVLNATLVCKRDVQAIGLPANVMTKPVRDLAVDGSL